MGVAFIKWKVLKKLNGKKSKGIVAGFIFIINLFDLPGNNLLKKKSYFTESLVEFPGH